MNWNSPEVRKAAELIQGSPLHFIKTVLGEDPYAEQLPIIESFKNNRYTVVKSGHSCGKDWLAARLALWFHIAHYPSIVVGTGPTDRQVVNVVWGELSAAYNKAADRAKRDIPGALPIGGRLLTQELQSGDPDHYMIGYTAKSAEAFQGFHKANVCVVVTEASGIEAEMWKGIKSLMTANNKARLFVVGNPLSDVESEFYQMCTSKADIYTVFTLDSERSPYCSKEWIAEMKAEYGEDSPIYQARVKGHFPTDLADTLIPLSWLEAARERWAGYEINVPAEWKARPKTAGVDVARFGSDLTSEARLENGRLWIEKVRQGQDTMATAGECVALHKQEKFEPENIRVDDTGVGGGVTDRCNEENVPVSAINFGAKAADEVKFADARTHIYWDLRTAIKNGLALDPRDNKLLRDLSVIKYKMTGKGQLRLEPKADLKKRTKVSPDRGDSAALAAASADVAKTISTGGRSNLGLIDYMKQMAATGPTSKEQPVGKRSLEDVPGVRVIAGGVSDAEAAKIAAARARFTPRS